MINILIVEDDPMVAMLNEQFCEMQSDTKVVANVRNAKEAMKIIDNNNIDLILLDVYLPEINGIDFLNHIRNKDKYIPVILISAANDKVTIKKALNLGIIDYLIKPFNIERFNIAFNKYMDYLNMIDSNESITQQYDLDKFLLNNSNASRLESSKIPKGLSKLTLRLICNTILEQNTSFSTEKLSSLVGISRISTRKYINFLVSIDLLKEKIEFRKIGRPILYYSLNSDKIDIIKKYLRTK